MERLRNLSEREHRLLDLAPVAKAWVYESAKVNNSLLPEPIRLEAKVLKDAFMEYMLDDAKKGGLILGKLLQFQQWEIESGKS